jgi:hypothetical protein
MVLILLVGIRFPRKQMCNVYKRSFIGRSCSLWICLGETYLAMYTLTILVIRLKSFQNKEEVQRLATPESHIYESQNYRSHFRESYYLLSKYDF